MVSRNIVAILAGVVAFSATLLLLPHMFLSQCAYGGNPYDYPMSPICCVNSSYECLSDASCASPPDSNDNVTLSLYWGFNYQGIEEYISEGQYLLSGVTWPTYEDCDCNQHSAGGQTGDYSSNGGYDETDVWASWTMQNMESVQWLNCPSGTPCASSGVEGPFVITFTDSDVGYIDVTC